MTSRTVHLDDLNGFEFQHLCAIIIESLGYGQVEEQALTGDGGKDLIIRNGAGIIVVECKHQPNTSLGRPIIQKLHSASISEGAFKGMVITTGGFSKQAIEHARGLRPPIELVDLAMLRDMASRAGIQLVLGQEASSIRTFRLMADQEVNQALVNHLSNVVVSKPTPIVSALSSHNIAPSLRPVYQVNYAVNADFSTSVGMVHRETSVGQFFIDGSDGSMLPESLTQYFSVAPREVIRRWEDVPPHARPSNLSFKIPASTVKGKALDSIIQKHTKTVYYRGRNNQSYSKLCTPSRNDVFIDDISQMYIPEYKVDYSLAGRGQTMSLANNGTSSIFVTNDSTTTCRYCNGKVIQGSRSLCNDCGQVSCTNNSFFKTKRHALQCEVCRKTLCRSCALYVQQFFFLKKIVCGRCADELARGGKQVKKLVRANEMPRS